MFHARIAIVLLFATVLPHVAEAEEIYIRSNRYAAIAYSPATNHYAYAYNHRSRCAAERDALARCDEDDARIVTWVSGGFCVLVRDDEGGWAAASSYGVGSSNLMAFDRAVNRYRKHSSGTPRIAVILSGDGQYVRSY